MIYFRINHLMDYAITPNGEYIFFSAYDKKYLRFKKNFFLDFIIEFFNYGNTMDSFLNKANKKNIEIDKLLQNLSFLLKEKIIIDELIEEKFDFEKFPISELAFSQRYGYQIRYIKEKYFDKKISSNFIQNKITFSNITIVGAGATGSMLAVMLAAIGVENITVIDGDIVEESNLSRQIFYKEKDIGSEYKVNSLKEFIGNFNSKVNFIAVASYIEFNNIPSLEKYIKNSNLIIQTADKPTGKIDEYVNYISNNLKIHAIFIHNDSIGPFIFPDETKDYIDLKKVLDKESGGAYSLSVQYQSEKNRVAYPVIIHGVFSGISILFEKILEYLITGDIPDLRNKVWIESSKKYLEF